MRWITTIEPSEYRIEGYDLGPLLFGHCLLLERFNLNEDKEELPTPLDLWRWLNITSRNHADARKWLSKDFSNMPNLARWAFCKTMKNEERFLVGLNNWADYLHENTATPKTLDSVNAGQSSTEIPRLQWLWNTAVTQLNYNPMELCEAPFGQLVWSILALNEQNGGSRIIGDRLEKVFEDLKCQPSA